MAAIVGNTSAQVVAQGVAAVVAVCINSLLSHHLGPAGFGRYALIYAYVGVALNVFASCGFGAIAVRDASQHADETERIFGSAAALQAVASLLSVFLLALYVHVTDHAQEELPVLVAGLELLLMPIDILVLVFQLRRRLVISAAVNILTSLSTLVTVALLVLRGNGVLAVVVASTVVAVFSRATLLCLAAQYFDWTKVRPSYSYCARLVRETWPLALGTTFAACSSQLPLIMLSKLTTSDEVGYFGAATRIGTQTATLPLLLWSSLYPLFARLAVEDQAELRRLLALTLRLMVAAASLVAVVGVLLAPFLMDALFGAAFAKGAIALGLLLAQSLLVWPGVIAGETLICLSRQRQYLAIQATGALLIVLAGPVLCWRFGATGAALAVVLGGTAIGIGSIAAAHAALGQRVSIFLPLIAASAVYASVVIGLAAAMPARFSLEVLGCVVAFGATMVWAQRAGRTLAFDASTDRGWLRTGRLTSLRRSL